MKLLIVGGVAGGATAAARARRLDEQAEIILFERGEHISFANCGLPYHIGGTIPRREDLLVTTPQALSSRYNVDIRTFSEVTAIDRENKQVTVHNLTDETTYTEAYDKLIISPGAEPLRPPIEGIDLPGIYNLRNIPDTDRIKKHVDQRQPREAVVVGGGFIGLEMAENLVERGVRVTIVEMLDQVMAPLDFEMASMVHAELLAHGVTLVLSDGVKSFAQNSEKLLVTTGQGRKVEADMVILSIGIRPENRLAKEAGLELCERGHIRVSSAMQTSDPDIFAVGDAVCVPNMVTGHPVNTALAGPANRQARIAADNALGRRSSFKGTLGSSVVKVFNQTAAGTGANERTLRELGIPYMVSYTHSGSHASYYPGADMMAIKLIYAPGTGRILGAQIVGGDGVDKRIDVLATAIKGSLTVYDLEELELAYAPPYSSAKDPVNMAGFVGANTLKGDTHPFNWQNLDKLDPQQHQLIDVRLPMETSMSGMVPGAINIPLDSLRSRLDELDPAKTYITYCAVGMRAYLAERILKQNGFKAMNLSGGYRTFLGAKEKLMPVKEENGVWKSE